jgi:hypothetical protein
MVWTSQTLQSVKVLCSEMSWWLAETAKSRFYWWSQPLGNLMLALLA